MPQAVFVSATPGAWELKQSTRVAEQLIRPTYLVDPEVELRPTKNQIDDLLNEIRRREEVGERVLVTTLTKKMSEDLTDYLLEAGVKARYLHSEIDTLERIQIIRELRLGDYDVLVGVNLLREGLDLPEVSLVAILDADKEGFLRGRTALVQTIGRAARHVNGRVLMYADKLTEAIKGALDETNRRRDDPARIQRGARHEADLDHEGRLGHRRAARARAAARPELAPQARRQGRGDDARGAREDGRRPRARDVHGRGGAPLRVRRQAARRDQGAAPGADGARARGDRGLTSAGMTPSMSFVLAILVSGLITGSLARLAIPGPDPMPIWLTIAIGLTGSIVGAVVGRALFGDNGYVVSFLSFGVAMALVAAYRRFVQKRPIFGAGAYAFPERGVGVEQQRERLQKLGIDPNALRPDPRKLERARLEATLQELHRAGLLDDEELAAKRAALDER